MRHLLYACLLAAALGAQPKIGPDELRIAYAPYYPRQAETFRTEAQLVDVTVVVRDIHGRTVNSLTREDFELYDRGRKREITAFSVRTAAPAGAPQNAAPTRSIALLFDDIFLDLSCYGGVLRPRPPAPAIGALLRMKAAAVKFLRDNLRPGDRVSLFGIWSGQVFPLSADIPKLVAALEWLTAHEVCPGQFNKLNAIEDVVDYLGTLPGRRSLVFTSLGLGRNRIQQDEIVAHALKAGVVIHTLNAAGVGSLAYTPLGDLAESTGGQYFHNNNDFDRGFRELGMAPETEYALGFVPEAVPDGGYHKLAVRVTAAGRNAVVYRPGYYAPSKQEEAHLRERPIDRIVMSAEAGSALPFSITALGDQIGDAVPAVSVVAHIDVKALEFRHRAGRSEQRLIFVAALLDPQRNVVIGKQGVLEFNLKDNSLAALANGINATLTLPAPPGSYALRTVVQQSDGRFTASTKPVELR
jgi:VWFA-related protein